MIYDVVLCVSSEHKIIALKAIKSIVIFSKFRKIFIITSLNNHVFFSSHLDSISSIILLDEDKIIGNKIDIKKIQNILKKRIGSYGRAGWYFQQFLKMAACNLPDISDHYLIWDSDTLMLRSIPFFSKKGKVLVNTKSENHKPYFTLMRNTIDLGKQVKFSFITEHFMINKIYMQSLIDLFKKKSPNDTSWVQYILDSMEYDHILGSGFSEFETYGNFITKNYKDSYVCRAIKSTRNGTQHYGKNINKFDIFGLMQRGYFFSTFETWQDERKNIILINKIIAKVLYILRFRTNRSKRKIKAASELED